MATQQGKLDRNDRKVLLNKIVSDCTRIADHLIVNWKPVDPAWPIIDGCAYIRLSDESQVTVEKGSLEQQLNIATSEAIIRSQQDRRNYRIVCFYIEPGLSGRDDARPQFLRMQADIEKRSYKFVVVKEASRIARRGVTFKKFCEICINADCEIFIRGFPFNPNDPTQLFQLDIMIAFAEFESNQTSRRIKENVFAAKSTSGKLNSTHRVLGLDQKVICGIPQSGFYIRNDEELKIVEWMMSTFVKYGSFQKTLAECEKRGVRNKDGDAFSHAALKTLLTNKKYAGFWEINAKNKEKDHVKLMPYEHYKLVDLPHGQVIDRELWDRVQEVVKRIAGNHDKNTQIRQVYPLSKLLKYEDSSPFHGTGAWGNGGKSIYYFNKIHGIRIPAEVIENAAKQTVIEIVKNSPALQRAIETRLKDSKSSNSLLQDQCRRLRDEIETANAEHGKLDRRLDFLLSDADTDEANRFRDQYKADSRKIRDRVATCEQQLSAIATKKQDLDQSGSFNLKETAAQARKTLDLIAANDPVALKNAYRELFDAVFIGEMDKDGTRPVRFVLKDNLASVNLEEKTSSGGRMVGPPGLEPGTLEL